MPYHEVHLDISHLLDLFYAQFLPTKEQYVLQLAIQELQYL